MPEHDIDVALSFAGEDRGYVHTVATILKDRGVAVFYDEFRTIEMWGEDLFSYLDDVYRNRSRYAVIFASASYARNIWTSHERQSIQARVMTDTNAYLLYVRLDDADIPGLRPTLASIDGRRVAAEAVAEAIIARVEARQGGADVPAPVFGVPLSTDERRRVLALRPAGWEHLILAGTIWQEWERLETKRLDHEMCFAAGTGQHVRGQPLEEFLRVSMDELATLASKLERVFGGGRLEWAVGTRDRPGDAVRIEHLGRRFGIAFEDLLDWAARIRATVCDPTCRTALELLAQLADEPTHRIGAFVDAMVEAAGEVVSRASARSTDDLRFTVTLDLTIPRASIEAFTAEVTELGARGCLD